MAIRSAATARMAPRPLTRPTTTPRTRIRRSLVVLGLATVTILVPFAVAAAIRGDLGNAALIVLVLPFGVAYAIAVLAFAAYVLKLVVAARRESARTATDRTTDRTPSSAPGGR